MELSELAHPAVIHNSHNSTIEDSPPHCPEDPGPATSSHVRIVVRHFHVDDTSAIGLALIQYVALVVAPWMNGDLFVLTPNLDRIDKRFDAGDRADPARATHR